MKTTTTNWQRILLYILIGFSLTSCHFNTTYSNREEDKKDAEKITSQFYDLVKQNDYTKTYKLFSEKFFAITDTVKLNNIFRTTVEKLGAIESMTLDKWETNVVKGTDEKSDYALQYIVKHKRFDSKETFTLTKENGEIKIIGYNINSDGFFTPDKK